MNDKKIYDKEMLMFLFDLDSYLKENSLIIMNCHNKLTDNLREF